VIAAKLRFVCYADEERSDGCKWVWLLLKASKLRVMPITLGAACKNFLGKECFSPCGDQPFRVEVSRMQCP